MKRKIGLIFICIVASLFSSCGKISGDNSVVINKAHSYFSDFYVKGADVFIVCKIEIANNSMQNRKIKLYAIMPDDVKIGLLKEEKLLGYSKDM